MEMMLGSTSTVKLSVVLYVTFPRALPGLVLGCKLCRDSLLIWIYYHDRGLFLVGPLCPSAINMINHKTKRMPPSFLFFYYCTYGSLFGVFSYAVFFFLSLILPPFHYHVCTHQTNKCNFNRGMVLNCAHIVNNFAP